MFSLKQLVPWCIAIGFVVVLRSSPASAQCERGWSDQFKRYPGPIEHMSVVLSFDPDGPGFQKPLLIISHDPTSYATPWGVSGNIAWSAYDGHNWRPIVQQGSTRAKAAVVWDLDGNGPIPPALFAGMDAANVTINGIPIHAISKWDGQTWEDAGDQTFTRCVDLKLLDQDGDGPLPPEMYAVIKTTDVFKLVKREADQWTFIAPMMDEHHDVCLFDFDGNGPQSASLVRANGDANFT